MTDYTLGLTAASIDAVLQGVDDGSLIPAINKIKTSQFVVDGTTGDPLPNDSAATSYLAGAQMALKWIVTTDVVDAIIDANGNLNATSGVVEYTFDKADNETPNTASLFASVMRCTDSANSIYVQDYADGSNGISITETATTVTMVIDFSDFAGGKVFGVSEQLGRLPIESTQAIKEALYLPASIEKTPADVTASRLSGVTYTNPSPIQPLQLGITIGGSSSATLNVEGEDVLLVASSVNARGLMTWIVPPLGEYTLTYTSLVKFVEG